MEDIAGPITSIKDFEAITEWIEDNDIAGDFVVGRDPDPSSCEWIAVLYNGDGEEIHHHNDMEILVGRGRGAVEAVRCFMEENGITKSEGES
jgi:hypothetical protein